MILSLYIARKFCANLVKVQIGIATLAVLLIATEELQFLTGRNASFLDAMSLIGSRLPEQFVITFPLVILLGSLFTFLGLSRTSELVVVRASGISALHILAAPLIVASLLGIFIVAALNPIVAATIRKYEEIHSDYSTSQRNSLSLSNDGIWLRQANETSYLIIQARGSSGDGVVLFNVRFNEFDTDGRLTRRIEAQRAQLSDGEWRLTQAMQWRFAARGQSQATDIRPFDVLTIPTNLTSDEILESFATPNKISIWKIPVFILQLEASGFSTIRHRLFLQSQLSSPLLLIAMVLIGAVFAFRPSRFGNTGVMALLAVLSGFVLFALKSVAESLGEAEQISIALAAWAPACAALLLAVTLLLHLEDG